MSHTLGPFQVDHPFLLAPMAGITHSPYRRMMRKRGSALVISELVSANGLQYQSERTRELLEFHEEERILGLQIFGETPENLVNACRYVQDLKADFVDLNLGCPVPKVVKKGAGAAMCRDPIRLNKILTAMVESVKIPVTIKIRTGWDSGTRNAIDVVHAAEDAGVSWVAIHGRTRAQGYSGEADWDFIGDVKARSLIPIIGNGDVNTPETANRRFKDYGVDGVMIGRAALRNPFIFEQSAKLYSGQSYSIPAIEEYWSFLENQRAVFDSFFPERRALLHHKKFLAWYSAGFPGCADFRRRIFSYKEADPLWNDAKEFFFEVGRGRDWSFLSEPFLMGGHG